MHPPTSSAFSLPSLPGQICHRPTIRFAESHRLRESGRGRASKYDKLRQRNTGCSNSEWSVEKKMSLDARTFEMWRAESSLYKHEGPNKKAQVTFRYTGKTKSDKKILRGTIRHVKVRYLDAYTTMVGKNIPDTKIVR